MSPDMTGKARTWSLTRTGKPLSIRFGCYWERAYEKFGLFPTLLEQDFNIPPLAKLVKEVERIAEIQNRIRLKQNLGKDHEPIAAAIISA
jgi:Protein of unknown function (DUF692)